MKNGGKRQRGPAEPQAGQHARQQAGRRARRRAFVFSVEALVSLLAAIALVAFVSSANRDLGWDSLERNALAQDLLETSVKEKSAARGLYAFAAGDAAAGAALKARWSELLSRTGAACARLEAGAGVLETKCAGNGNDENDESGENGGNNGKRFSASATRALFDGAVFYEARLTLYFSS